MYVELMVGSDDGEGESEMDHGPYTGEWQLTWPPGNGAGWNADVESCSWGSGFGDTSDGDGAGGAAPKW